MGETWQFRIYGPVGCLIPIIIVLAALVGIGAWTAIGWLI